MKKKRKKVLLGIVIFSVVLVSYVAWDNQRVKITKQDILIEDLPEQLVGFSILQISDLHEKEFGKNQEKLLNKINALNYDVLIFTGDMLDNPTSENYSPLYNILEGLHNKEHVLYVPGNSDQPSYQVDPVFKKSEFVRGIEDRGAHFLESDYLIEIAGVTIQFVDLELAIIKKPDMISGINGVNYPAYATNSEFKAYKTKLWQEMKNSNGAEVVIALNHYPVVDARIDYIYEDPNTEWQPFDLIIAGHYHGGQIRLPFIGALFVPEPWYSPNSFFPPKDRVKGLWEYNETQQYVSAGLGTSDAIPFLKFRLFNPPEINVLQFDRQ